MYHVNMPTIDEIERAVVTGSSMSLVRTCGVCGETKDYREFKRVGNNKNHHSKYSYQPIYIRRPYCRDCRKKREGITQKITSEPLTFWSIDFSVLARILLNDKELSDKDILNYYGKKVFNECIKVRDAHTCKYCGQFGDTVDHIIPQSKGGETSFANCVCSCENCQQIKDNNMKLRSEKRIKD